MVHTAGKKGWCPNDLTSSSFLCVWLVGFVILIRQDAITLKLGKSKNEDPAIGLHL